MNLLLINKTRVSVCKCTTSELNRTDHPITHVRDRIEPAINKSIMGNADAEDFCGGLT